MADQRSRLPGWRAGVPWRRRNVLAAGAAAWAAVLALPGGAVAQTGAFSQPFAEPTIEGQRTDYKCIRRLPKVGLEPSGPLFTPHWECKPTAGSLNVTPVQNRLLYWNALEGTENINELTLAEYGSTAENDQTRRLDLNPADPFRSSWTRPTPVDGGGNPPPRGNPDKEFLLVPNEVGQQLDPAWNDGSLFCADNNILADGRIIATGGSTYKNDPPTGSGPATPPGPAEVQGMRNTAVYDPRTNRWTQTPRMNYGRWYPTLVTLGERGGQAGDQFVASGVKNLIKAYDKPDPNSPRVNRTGDNVQETEVRDSDTGQWVLQGPKEAQDPSDRPLPLYPRLHLLPNGHVYYNAAGQVFNPAGESYNQMLWNVAAAFDPATKRWNDLGVPGAGAGEVPDPTDGFRGSTFSVMLPLKPGDDGSYKRASFLTAGGILGTTPGTYFPVTDSRIDTVDTGAASEASPSGALSSERTGPLNHARWYTHGTLLPTGEVLASSGGDRDAVVTPGFEQAIRQVEIFNPETKTWRTDATMNRMRTYHNTATLLPDARVLIGGHAPLPWGYGRNQVPQDPRFPHRPYAGGQPYNQPSSINDGRDPTFEIYTPPYLRMGVAQPSAPSTQTCQPNYGGYMAINLGYDASQVDKVVIARNASVTHVIDGDQRTVELPVVYRAGNTVVVRRPPNANVAPPGPYMLFVNKKTSQGPIPSKAKQLFIGLENCPSGYDGTSGGDDGDDD